MISGGFLSEMLQPVFGPLLNLGPFMALLIICLLLTFIVTIIYKFTTKQELMKKLKDELKEMQDKMKALKDSPEKMMKVQKKLMSKNMEYMRHSFRATLFTIIPVIIIFGWLNAHLAYNPLLENEPFNVTLEMSELPTSPPIAEVPEQITIMEGYPKGAEKKVVYSFSGVAGIYDSPPLRFEYNNNICEVPLVIEAEGGKDYVNPKVECKAGQITRAVVSNAPLKPLGNLSLFGWNPGWFGTYIILSVVFSMVIRKVMKIY